MKVKDIEKQIQDILNNYVGHDYKKNALMELDKIYTQFHVPTCSNLEFIVEQYPDFNHIRINLTLGDKLMLTICVEPNLLNKKTIHKLAKMICSIKG